MHASASVGGDSWHNVTDPKERKRIQDRLAQRARRRRLANDYSVKRRSKTFGTNVQPPSKSEDNGKARHLASQMTTAPQPPVGVSQSILTALFINGQMLGIKCGASIPAKSCVPSAEVPCSLRATILQMSTVHWTWIDRYPFEDCRDELIMNSGAYEEEEYLYDLFSMPSFSIQPGYPSWDPQGWAMEEEWKRKWGWLFPSLQGRPSKIAADELFCLQAST